MLSIVRRFLWIVIFLSPLSLVLFLLLFIFLSHCCVQWIVLISCYDLCLVWLQFLSPGCCRWRGRRSEWCMFLVGVLNWTPFLNHYKLIWHTGYGTEGWDNNTSCGFDLSICCIRQGAAGYNVAWSAHVLPSPASIPAHASCGVLCQSREMDQDCFVAVLCGTSL